MAGSRPTPPSGHRCSQTSSYGCWRDWGLREALASALVFQGRPLRPVASASPHFLRGRRRGDGTPGPKRTARCGLRQSRTAFRRCGHGLPVAFDTSRRSWIRPLPWGSRGMGGWRRSPATLDVRSPNTQTIHNESAPRRRYRPRALHQVAAGPMGSIEDLTCSDSESSLNAEQAMTSPAVMHRARGRFRCDCLVAGTLLRAVRPVT